MVFSPVLYLAFPLSVMILTPLVLGGIGIRTSTFWAVSDVLNNDLRVTCNTEMTSWWHHLSSSPWSPLGFVMIISREVWLGMGVWCPLWYGTWTQEWHHRARHRKWQLQSLWKQCQHLPCLVSIYQGLTSSQNHATPCYMYMYMLASHKRLFNPLPQFSRLGTWVSLRLNFICTFCSFASYGVWVGITFLSSLYELVCYAHVFPCTCIYNCIYSVYNTHVHGKEGGKRLAKTAIGTVAVSIMLSLISRE